MRCSNPQLNNNSNELFQRFGCVCVCLCFLSNAQKSTASQLSPRPKKSRSPCGAYLGSPCSRCFGTFTSKLAHYHFEADGQKKSAVADALKMLFKPPEQAPDALTAFPRFIPRAHSTKCSTGRKAFERVVSFHKHTPESPKLSRVKSPPKRSIMSPASSMVFAKRRYCPPSFFGAVII